MKRAIFLQHVAREGPGLIAEIATRLGMAIETVRLDAGERVPMAVAVDDVLIVMGGPMGLADIDDARYGFLASEIHLLRKVLAAEQPVLGICLGAQLLAQAAGARVRQNQRMGPNGHAEPAPEVGFGTVRLLHRHREPALRGLAESIPVLHWHGDTFDLPSGAVHLAKSDACANQAFRLASRAFGLQFHVEADADMVRRWALEDADFVTAALGAGATDDLIAASEEAAARVRTEGGEQLIRGILDSMLRA